MAAGMFTKQATFLTARYLNDVNDAVQQGAVNTLPSGVQSPAWVQDIPGDRICIDDATAYALSDPTANTAIGAGGSTINLFGGIYMYVLTASTQTQAPTTGRAAFYKAADIGATTTGLNYEVTCDAQTTAAIPTFFVGVFLNAISKGYYGWVQIAGVATCLFDSTLTATAAGNWVSVKVSPTIASTFDCGAAVGVVTLSALVGTAIDLPVATATTGTATRVAIWRGFGRI